MSLKAFTTIVTLTLCTLMGAGQAFARPPSKKTKTVTRVAPPVAVPAAKDGAAEARLIEIYRLIGKGGNRAALEKAEKLVQDFPTFALAQLVYGDLLSARIRPLTSFGDVSSDQRLAAEPVLTDLRTESQLRLKALRERPPAGTLPSGFLLLPSQTKHAIAIDASHARLYLFENRASGLTLVADYYISVGKLGVEKQLEGDMRTPLGVYYITSQLDPKTLKDYYGSGALPINYPNVLDIKRGKTGKGIWLHGTPPGQFSRPPLASDGCVVLANADLNHIIKAVEIRSTPVLIANQLKWVAPLSTQAQTRQFESQFSAWQKAKSSGSMAQVTNFYATDFSTSGKSLTDWLPTLQREVTQLKGRTLDIKDLSLLHWVDASETMVVTFGEVATGQRTGAIKRQYWSRQGKQWKIFFEGVIG